MAVSFSRNRIWSWLGIIQVLHMGSSPSFVSFLSAFERFIEAFHVAEKTTDIFVGLNDASLESGECELS